MLRWLSILLLFSATAVILPACSWLPQVKDETADWSAEKYYNEAHDALNEGNYNRAIKLYEQLEGRYPYGRHAQQAILESAYANYKTQEPAAALAACDRFIKLYPNHPYIDYAYYLKGLVNFNEDLGLFGGLANQDMSERDPKATRESYETFKELLTKFPQSKYASDARARSIYLVNALADHELHVARYYYRRGAYVAAINRAQTVLVNYPNTGATPDALAVVVESYDKLGMPKLKEDANRVYAQTFPGRPLRELDPPWWAFWK
jgi:outer membrane protein assembly factor BamD